jgi:hypothetical protein
MVQRSRGRGKCVNARNGLRQKWLFNCVELSLVIELQIYQRHFRHSTLHLQPYVSGTKCRFTSYILTLCGTPPLFHILAPLFTDMAGTVPLNASVCLCVFVCCVLVCVCALYVCVCLCDCVCVSVFVSVWGGRVAGVCVMPTALSGLHHSYVVSAQESDILFVDKEIGP